MMDACLRPLMEAARVHKTPRGLSPSVTVQDVQVVIPWGHGQSGTRIRCVYVCRHCAFRLLSPAGPGDGAVYEGIVG